MKDGVDGRTTGIGALDARLDALVEKTMANHENAIKNVIRDVLEEAFAEGALEALEFVGASPLG